MLCFLFCSNKEQHKANVVTSKICQRRDKPLDFDSEENMHCAIDICKIVFLGTEEINKHKKNRAFIL